MPPRHLDATDIVLMQMLLSNSRSTYREMADFLSASHEEVERRVRSMAELGVLRQFVARLRPGHLKAVGVLVYGNSDLTGLDEAMGHFCKNDSTSWVGLGSGGRVYAGALLRRLSQLDGYVQFLKEEGMRDAVFGIRSPPPDKRTEPLSLDDLDFRILGSMHHDARRSAFEVAEDIGSDKAEVEARIGRMLDGEAVEFSVVLSPEATSDVLCMFHLHHRVGGSLREFMRTKLNEHSPSILFFNAYRNLPDLITALGWVEDMAELRDMKASLEQGPGMERVEANVLLASRAVETWADALIEERAGRAKPVGR